jgi:hypothetical protein
MWHLRMKAPISPFVSALLASLLSAAVLLAWLWKTTMGLVAQRQVHVAQQLEEERPEKPWDFWTVEIESLAKELEEARADVAKRELALSLREKRISEEAAELERTRAQIEAMQGEIKRQLIEVKDTEKKNLKPLAATYSQIAPASAAAATPRGRSSSPPPGTLSRPAACKRSRTVRTGSPSSSAR